MDLHTLHVSSAITNVTCGIVLAVAWLVRSEKTFLGWWAGSSIVFAGGLLLQIEGDTHPTIGALTYGLLAAGTLLMLAGFRSFDGRRAFSPLMLFSLPMPPLVHVVMSALALGPEWPELSTFVVTCLVAAQIPTYVLLQNQDHLTFRWVVGATYAAQLVITVSVIVWGSALITPENVTLAISLTDQVCSTIGIACVLGMVIERDNRRLDRIAHRDALTGCMNRAGLLAYKETATGPHGILLADLDHFKRLNDRHGHAAGDEVLKDFVRRAEKVLPVEALFARSGGEEFVALLPGGSRRDAETAAVTLRGAVNARGLDYEGTPIAYTVSIGVSDVASDESIKTGIRRADAALYKAKRSGRDRIAVHDETLAAEETRAIPA